MSRELVIERSAFGVRAALLDGGRLIEMLLAEDMPGRVRDRIFFGRVRALDRTLGAAFVDCGLAQDAWLTARHARTLAGDAPLQEGQPVLVQGLREAAAGKGPRVTGDIALPGMLLAVRPRRSDVELSARLMRSPEGEAARERARRLFPDGGILLRTAAARASDAELLAEAERLGELWRGIEAKAATARAPACLLDLGDPVARILVALAAPDIVRIAVGDAAAFAGVRTWLERHQPALVGRLELLPDAFAATGADEQLDQALSPVVPLPGGGSLILEPTAALTAIDVNGGGRPALEVDLAAVPEIARQIRLRRLGGSIVVDFVDLANRRERARVDTALREALRDDPLPVRVWPMSDLGLAQISRQRAGPSLADEFGRVCPTCAGTGLLASLRRRSEALAHDLDRMRGRARVRLALDLHGFLEGDGAAVRERLRPMAAFQPDATLAPGDYRIDPEVTS